MREKTHTTSMEKHRWLVLVGGIVIALCIGLLYTWSIYVLPICEQYGWQQDQVALMGNVMVATLCLGAFIGGQLLPKVGGKVCAIIGAVLYGGFMFVSAFVTSPALMYVTYGLLSGTGCGILYNSIMFTLGMWFPDRRGLVMGLYLGIFGLSATIMAKPISAMLASIGVKMTMMTTGLIFLIVLLAIAVFLMRTPPEGWLPAAYTPPADKASAHERSLTVRQGLKTRTFWMITAAQVLLVITYNFISAYVAVFIVEEKQLAAEFAVTVVAAMGIGSFSGRICGGFLTDRFGNKPTYAFACLCSIVGCGMLLPARSTGIIVVMFFLIAFGYGCRTPVYGTLSVDNFGAKNSSAMAGFTNLFTIVTSLLSGVMTASIREQTGSFAGSFYVAIAAAVIGCTIILLLPKTKPVDVMAPDTAMEPAA